MDILNISGSSRRKRKPKPKPKRDIFVIDMPGVEGNTFDWNWFRNRKTCDHVWMYHGYSRATGKNIYKCCECGRIDN